MHNTYDVHAGGGETQGGAGEVGGGNLAHVANYADPLCIKNGVLII